MSTRLPTSQRIRQLEKDIKAIEDHNYSFLRYFEGDPDAMIYALKLKKTLLVRSLVLDTHLAIEDAIDLLLQNKLYQVARNRKTRRSPPMEKVMHYFRNTFREADGLISGQGSIGFKRKIILARLLKLISKTLYHNLDNLNLLRNRCGHHWNINRVVRRGAKRRGPKRYVLTYEGENEVLMDMKFEPVKYVIPGIIVEGLTLLAGKPKVGKSWLLLHAAIAVARGGFTLGDIHCAEGDVLYCALEDNPRRLKARMGKLLGMDTAGAWRRRLHFQTEMPRLADGGLALLKEWITFAERPRLIIIDTLSMVRVSLKKNDTAFQADYDAVKDLRKLAADHHVAIVLVHHLRKADSDDPFDTVNATLGLTAAVDSVLIVRRDANGNHTLHGRGRDLVELEKALGFNRDNCTWMIIGDASEVKRSADRKAIVSALIERGEEMTAKDIATETGLRVSKLRPLLKRMVGDGEIRRGKRGRFLYTA